MALNHHLGEHSESEDLTNNDVLAGGASFSRRFALRRESECHPGSCPRDKWPKLEAGIGGLLEGYDAQGLRKDPTHRF